MNTSHSAEVFIREFLQVRQVGQFYYRLAIWPEILKQTTVKRVS